MLPGTVPHEMRNVTFSCDERLEVTRGIPKCERFVKVLRKEFSLNFLKKDAYRKGQERIKQQCAAAPILRTQKQPSKTAVKRNRYLYYVRTAPKWCIITTSNSQDVDLFKRTERNGVVNGKLVNCKQRTGNSRPGFHEALSGPPNEIWTSESRVFLMAPKPGTTRSTKVGQFEQL